MAGADETGLPLTDRPSANFGDRRGGALPDMVVLHYTAMLSVEAAAERLCDPAFEVSAHYLIGSDGAIIRLVPEALRAWHAGAGQWGDVTDVNSRSIGIELANTGRTPFAAAQMTALEMLLAEILARRDIRPERVIAHSDMAPSRKGDPGPRFDWRRLALQGLSIWPDPAQAGPSDLPLDLALKTVGYAADLDPALALAAFRLRFRPWANGPAGPGDLAAARNLALRFPVDRFPVDRGGRQA